MGDFELELNGTAILSGTGSLLWGSDDSGSLAVQDSGSVALDYIGLGASFRGENFSGALELRGLIPEGSIPDAFTPEDRDLYGLHNIGQAYIAWQPVPELRLSVGWEYTRDGYEAVNFADAPFGIRPDIWNFGPVQTFGGTVVLSLDDYSLTMGVYASLYAALPDINSLPSGRLGVGVPIGDCSLALNVGVGPEQESVPRLDTNSQMRVLVDGIFSCGDAEQDEFHFASNVDFVYDDNYGEEALAFGAVAYLLFTPSEARWLQWANRAEVWWNNEQTTITGEANLARFNLTSSLNFMFDPGFGLRAAVMQQIPFNDADPETVFQLMLVGDWSHRETFESAEESSGNIGDLFSAH